MLGKYFKKTFLKSMNAQAISSENIEDAISHVFYVTSWGYAADHWFSWFAKSLNAHPEIFAYLANEGSRPKYFPEERSRADRPDLCKFIRFMADVGMTYTAIGDCYSYRPTMMQSLINDQKGSVPIIQLTRHPYPWLFFHVRWRAKNMRMLSGENNPLDHEWERGCDHELFNRLDLRPYTKSDVEVWATYQGMWKMNDVVNDSKTVIRQVPIENIVVDPKLFCEIISFLTRGRVRFDDQLLNHVYSWVYEPFRGENKFHLVPKKLRVEWPDWKIEAFDKIVSAEAKQCFLDLGYEL